MIIIKCNNDSGQKLIIYSKNLFTELDDGSIYLSKAIWIKPGLDADRILKKIEIIMVNKNVFKYTLAYLIVFLKEEKSKKLFTKTIFWIFHIN